MSAYDDFKPLLIDPDDRRNSAAEAKAAENRLRVIHQGIMSLGTLLWHGATNLNFPFEGEAAKDIGLLIEHLGAEADHLSDILREADYQVSKKRATEFTVRVNA